MNYEFKHGVTSRDALDSDLRFHQRNGGWELIAATYESQTRVWNVIFRRPCSKCDGTGRRLLNYETVEHSHGRESVNPVYAKCECLS